MGHINFFYNCSRQYVEGISRPLYDEVTTILSRLKKRKTQAEINRDIFWLLATDGWSYDSTPVGLGSIPPGDLQVGQVNLDELKKRNDRNLCLTATTLDARWRSDFPRVYGGKLVQLEVQFGKVESMFRDFCGFKIARYEKRLALGIEIVMSQPGAYFSHRRQATSGMAYFDIAKATLPAIGLGCPIWLLGIE